MRYVVMDDAEIVGQSEGVEIIDLPVDFVVSDLDLTHLEHLADTMEEQTRDNVPVAALLRAWVLRAKAYRAAPTAVRSEEIRVGDIVKALSGEDALVVDVAVGRGLVDLTLSDGTEITLPCDRTVTVRR